MWAFPVLLDSRPAFLPRERTASLLLAPLGDTDVLRHLRARLAAVTKAPPLVVAPFEVDGAYADAIRLACPDVEAIHSLPDFVERLHTYEPSDYLLLADPACFPLEAHDPGFARLGGGDDPRAVAHMVAFERASEGTREYVDTDAAGRVRAIQRYYASVTWPFAAGVACSLVPVACLRASLEPPLGSLSRLRSALAMEGVPSRDVMLERGAVNLASEQGLLAMNERSAHAAASRAAANGRGPGPVVAPGARVHSTAQLVGPVLLLSGAEVEEGATVIGPAVICAAARIGRNATVAQCVVGPGQQVAPGTVLRHRVYLGGGEPEAPGEPEAASPRRADEAWQASTIDLVPEAHDLTAVHAVKRALDVLAAAAGLILLAPLCLVIAILVKLESRGPLLFGHRREGRGGRPFRCWKFRTMVPGADVMQRRLAGLNQMDGPQFKLGRDPRRTRVGRLLTRANLDELPQLWNVLVGEMSLVGPRPSPFRENQVCVPWREGRLSVRPGITGLWQVCRHDRDKADFHQWIYFDLLYVRNFSLWLDLKILVLTFVSFARGGHIPLSWLLPPSAYGERRAAPRAPETRPLPGDLTR
jgi:lipopolysaccharide/colanic/teichoic acid biosynthesis glycosyltransferase